MIIIIFYALPTYENKPQFRGTLGNDPQKYKLITSLYTYLRSSRQYSEHTLCLEKLYNIYKDVCCTNSSFLLPPKFI